MARFRLVIGTLLVQTLVLGPWMGVIQMPCTRRKQAVFPLTQLSIQHRQQITDHLLALAPADRQQRFMGVVSDHFIERYVASLVPARDALIGAFDGPCLIGLMHAGRFRLRDGPGRLAIDIGLSVAEHARRQGLAGQLLRAGVAAGRRLGARQMVVMFAGSNAAMHALLRSHLPVVTQHGSEVRAVLDLQAAAGAHNNLSLPLPPAQPLQGMGWAMSRGLR
jgi:ribosomal protein S18 acetylase RimI-like enzyme